MPIPATASDGLKYTYNFFDTFKIAKTVIFNERGGRQMIYERIRGLREDKDWTQKYIAGLLYINRRTYSAYENGVNSMSPEVLIKLSKIHNTSIDYLLGQTDNPAPYERKK
jgi:DNA-binding XRE family transcriptional regulator